MVAVGEEREPQGSKETCERPSSMIHLTSVRIPTRQLLTGSDVVLMQRPLVTVGGPTDGNRRDVSAQFCQRGPVRPRGGGENTPPSDRVYL